MSKIKALICGILILFMSGINPLSAQDQETKDDTAIREKITALAQTALVRVHFEFQKDPEEGMPEDYSLRAYITNKTTWDISGILVQSLRQAQGGEPAEPPEGTVLINDSMLKRKYLKKITVVDGSGNEYEAELASFLTKYPAAFLKIKGDKKPTGSINFVEPGELNSSRKFYLASLFKDNENWFIKTLPLGLSISTPYESQAQIKPWFNIFAREQEDISSALIALASRFEGRGASLIKSAAIILFDEKARPIGVPLEGRIELDGDRYGWNGPELLRSPAVTYADLDKKTEEIKKQYAGCILEVKFLFRQPEKEKNEYGSYSRGQRYYYPGGEEEDDDERGLDITEKKLYGLAVDGKKIFIPRDLPDELIHRIENIEVLVNESKYPARFLGIYKDFTGMMIELADPKAVVKPPDIYKVNRPELGRALLTLQIKEKFNKRHEDVHYDRFTGIAKGYKNEIQYAPSVSFKTGSFFVSFDGEPVGVLLSRKRELEDRLSGGSSYYSFYYTSGGGDIKPYFFSELKKYFTGPAAWFDKKLVPLSDREMKRIIWLGTGFQSLTKDLAEQLGCQKITREGKLGLLINHIHDDSPAAKAGLKTGDVLLKIQEQDKDTPIELMSQGGYDPYGEVYARFGEMEDFSYFAESGMRPWPAANNYLNQILTQIGEDKKITLTYWRENKELTQDFILEKAPYDFESAEKYKDETIGLTIRELTYEVRYAWRLDKNYQAVIVGKVEEGSKAAIGGIGPYELITRIEDQPIGSIADYKKVMESLTADKTKEKAKFTVEQMGKSRLVDVELKK